MDEIEKTERSGGPRKGDQTRFERERERVCEVKIQTGLFWFVPFRSRFIFALLAPYFLVYS